MFITFLYFFFFFKQKTAYEMRISDWSSDVCSSDLLLQELFRTSHARRCPATLSCSGAVLRLPGRTPPSASAGTNRSFDMHRHPNAHRGRRLRGFRILLAGLALAAASAVHADYVFTTIDYPGADFTDVRGINNAGEIVGYAQNASGNFGFTYSGGHFSRLPPAPGGRTINGHGINDSGLIVGSAASDDGTTTEGFILDGSTTDFRSED